MYQPKIQRIEKLYNNQDNEPPYVEWIPNVSWTDRKLLEIIKELIAHVEELEMKVSELSDKLSS